MHARSSYGMPGSNTRSAAAAVILGITTALIWWVHAANHARSETVLSDRNPDAAFLAYHRSMGRALSLAQMWLGAMGGSAAILVAGRVRKRRALWIVGVLNLMVVLISVLYLFTSL